MERLIPSIIQLINELDEKHSSLSGDEVAGGLLGSQEKIKEYVNELIEEIEYVKKNKSGRNGDKA